MIYFTEITKTAAKMIEFQFYPKELPENISIKRRTKLHKIEYTGGVITNQIIGIYQEPIEWEGCFFGTYNEGGKLISAKQRADELKKLQGRPIRCVFAVPSGEHKIPGITSAGMAKNNEEPKQSGDSGVYIIEELDFTIHNHADIDYRIKLAPHVSQKKIKPKDITVQAIKIQPDVVKQSSKEVSSAKPTSPSGKGAADGAAKEATASQRLTDNFEAQRLRAQQPKPTTSKPTTPTTPPKPKTPTAQPPKLNNPVTDSLLRQGLP